MCSRFKIFAVLLLVLLCSQVLRAQYPVRVTITVAPPYPPHVQDYMDQPNKIMATLFNSSGSKLNVYLQGSITGEGGIHVYTDPAYKMPSPVVLNPGQLYYVTPGNLEQIFSADHLVYEGITEHEIIYGNGLPEGEYQICLQAFFYDTGEPASSPEPLGCSAPFVISDLEPPVILQPLCESEIIPSVPQQVVFSWTRPPNAPTSTRFKLKVIEVLPSDRNINDALQSAVHPIFLEKDVQVTNYLLGPADPALVEGKTYAFAVVAYDRLQKVVFRNGGQSEVCSFTYKGAVTGKQNKVSPHANPPSGTVISNLIFKTTTLSGKLVYSYNDDASQGVFPLGLANLKLVVRYFLKSGGKDILIGRTPWGGINPDEGYELALAKTDPNGNFVFTYRDPVDLGLVLDNYTISVNGFMQSGQLYRAAFIEIQPPHSEYYLDFHLGNVVTRGQTLNLGTVRTVARSCKLTVKVKSPSEDKPGGVPDPLFNNVGAIQGATVLLLRNIDFSYKLYPEKDGIPDTDPGEKFRGMNVVAKTITNERGEAVFNNVVWHHNPSFRYYLYVVMEGNTNLNYTMNPDAVIPWDPVKPKENLPDPSEVRDLSTFYANFQYLPVTTEIRMYSKFPAVTGMVQDLKESSPVPGAVIKMLEYGQVNNDFQIAFPGNMVPISASYMYDRSKYLQDWGKIDTKLSNRDCACWPWIYLYAVSGPDGMFRFDDLLMTYTGNKWYNGFSGTNELQGPKRNIVVTCDGYSQALFTVNGSQPLRIGEKYNVVAQLNRGAMIKGKIVDGESGLGLEAKFRFLDDLRDSTSKPNGFFEGYPAKLLPGTKQYLLVEKKDYMTDTMEVIVDNAVTDVGVLRIFTKRRRLNVIVTDRTTKNTIAGALVELPAVAGTCPPSSGKTNCPLNASTSMYGVAKLAFVNAGDDNNISYEVVVSVPPGQNGNYETKKYSLKIPYSQQPTLLKVELPPAACIKGKVYAGPTDSSLVAGAVVSLDVSMYVRGYRLITGRVTATTDAQGNYTLYNVPVRAYKQTVRAVKSQSQLVGDSLDILISKSGNECITHDFHLTVYNDMDITNLMGFPICVTNLKDLGAGQGAIVNGFITGFPANEQFSVPDGNILRFYGIRIVPDNTLKNQQGIPVSKPYVLPLKTLDNDLAINVYNEWAATLSDNKLGMELDKITATNLYGVIKGKIRVEVTNFNGSGFTLPELWLASGVASGTDKLRIAALFGDPTVKKPLNLPNGIYVCQVDGSAVKYSLSGFQNLAFTTADKSLLKPGALSLDTRLQTSIPNPDPSKPLAINLGPVEFKKNTPIDLSGNSMISVAIGKWTLKSDKWSLNPSGLILNQALLNTGFVVRCENIRITASNLVTDQAVVHLDTMRLLGVQEIFVTTTNKGLVQIYTPGGMKWQVYASTNPQYPEAGYMSGLNATGSGDQVRFKTIRLVSDGLQEYVLKQVPVTINRLLTFTPDPGGMSVYENNFKIRGEFDLGFPDGDSPKSKKVLGNAGWKKVGQNLTFNLDSMDPMIFFHSNLRVALVAEKFTDQLFTAKGNVSEDVTLPPVRVTLSKDPVLTSLIIDSTDVIPISKDNTRRLEKLAGGMKVVNNTWDTFWFEGEMVGLNGISENHQRMRFDVNGAITAKNQTIKVSDISDDFPGMEWSYDFANSRLTGNAGLHQNLGGIKVDGTIQCIVDGNGWYFQAGGQMQIPGLGGGNVFGLFGDYNNVPPSISAGFGTFKCIPSAFKTHISGFLLSAGVNKPLISPIEYSFPLVATIKAGVDLGLNARTYMSFGSGGTVIGMGLLGTVHAYFEGSFDVTCTSVKAGFDVQLGINGEYNTNGTYMIDGCASFDLDLYGQQCLGALDVCCGDCCVEVQVGTPTLGVKIHYDQDGSDLKLIKSSCDSQCP